MRVKISLEDQRYKRGIEALRKVNEEGITNLIQSMDAVAPDLARYVIEFAYGDVYTRPGLRAKQRELCIVAALTALGNREDQLRDHIQAALNIGCTRQELVETILMMAVYAGFPAAINAMQIARERLLHE
ncbi:MAG TPA: carboxymuconolactone decarboxylase family protein [Candidatus Bathyarchaeia archaeon]|nr:carboxymuconolactone decarboxylase family protein [Candidatus Bathyarchaeia archaeon]